MRKEKVLLLGYGDIASRLAQLLIAQGSEVHAVRRSAQAPQSHIVLHQADCRHITDMEAILTIGFDVIVMTMVPTEISDQGYKTGYVDTVNTLITILKKHQNTPRLLLFVSSTSVYGQQDASWIDEDSPTEPTSYSGKRLLEAEQQLQQYQQDSGQGVCCVRFSGIYGPGRRRLIEQVIKGHGAPDKPVLYSNRIHADDCAGVLAHLIQQQKIKGIDSLYIATDCEPVPLYEVKHYIADRLHLPKGHLKNTPAPERMLRSSKRCSNRRLLKTGYQFIYPTFKVGYSALINESL